MTAHLMAPLIDQRREQLHADALACHHARVARAGRPHPVGVFVRRVLGRSAPASAEDRS